MARGKYAARAAVRRESTETAAEIDAYQHAIRRLTDERNELRERLDSERRANAREIRTLRACMEANVSPEVKAAHAEIAKLRGKVEDLKRQDRQRRTIHEKMFMHMQCVLVACGFSGAEATDLLSAYDGNLDRVVYENGRRPRSREEALAIERANIARRVPSRPQDDVEWRTRYATAVAEVSS